jgi:hypothetical protein
MELSLLGRILLGAFAATVLWILWKQVAYTWWHKTFLILMAVFWFLFLTSKHIIMV